MFVDDKVAGEVILAPWQSLLLDAANLIEQKGWCQGRAQDGNKVCVTEAMLRVSDEDDVYVCLYADARLRQYLGWDLSISIWNDLACRTKAEVLSTLRACAAQD